jgi:hypothetical protein
MATKLEQYQELQAFVRKDAEEAARKVYAEMSTKFGVASVPLHRHNGADSPILGNSSIRNFSPLPAVAGTATVPLTDASSGVASPSALGAQIINNPAQSTNVAANVDKNAPNIYVMPIPIIYGFGNPGDANYDFHGGNAPIGSMVLFINPTNAVQLFIRADRDGFTEGWWGVTLTDTEA